MPTHKHACTQHIKMLMYACYLIHQYGSAISYLNTCHKLEEPFIWTLPIERIGSVRYLVWNLKNKNQSLSCISIINYFDRKLTSGTNLELNLLAKISSVKTQQWFPVFATSPTTLCNLETQIALTLISNLTFLNLHTNEFNL